MKIKNIILKILISCHALMSMSVFAATSTGSNTVMKANATMASSCQVSAKDIVFGTIGTTSGGITQSTTGSVSVICTKNTAYSITLGLGTNGNASINYRYMVGSSNSNNKISYSICASSCTNGQVWYNTTDSSVNGTGTGATQTYTMYGAVANGYYTPDNYSDTSTATITY